MGKGSVALYMVSPSCLLTKLYMENYIHQHFKLFSRFLIEKGNTFCTKAKMQNSKTSGNIIFCKIIKKF